METSLELLCKDLLDNGQPGRLTKIDSRLSKLENWRSYITGALAVIGLIVGALVAVAAGK
jgi:hypothetical protein